MLYTAKQSSTEEQWHLENQEYETHKILIMYHSNEQTEQYDSICMMCESEHFKSLDRYQSVSINTHALKGEKSLPQGLFG